MSSSAVTAPERPAQDEETARGVRLLLADAPTLLLAGAEDDEGNEPHICRGID